MGHVGLLLMRLITGGLFAAHGYPKLFGGHGKAVHPMATRYLGEGFGRALERGGVTSFAESLARLGVPAPRLMAVVVGMTELVGGLMLITGVFTRLAACALAVNRMFAIKLAHWKQGLIGSASGSMYGLSMLAGMLALLGNGPGALSLDGGSERWLATCLRFVRRPVRANRLVCDQH
jgi:putative oxidoreductase